MFTPEERQIYRFHNGTREVARDPADLLERLELKRPANYEQVVEALRSPDRQTSAPAAALMLAWIEGVFGVRRLDDDGAGLTRDEMFKLLGDFMAWLGDQKKTTPPPPSSSPTTPDSPSSAPAPSPTASASDCGCTG